VTSDFSGTGRSKRTEAIDSGAVALRWLARRCRRDADFAAAFEEEVTNQLVTHQAKIDWSQIDWEQVVKIVMMILAAFGVL
jgi:hypothetical protein